MDKKPQLGWDMFNLYNYKFMKKKWFNDKGSCHSFFKWLRVMKLTLFFLLATLVHVSASVYSQQTKLSISLKDAKVKDVLRTIEDQSEFYFLYKNVDIDVNRIVSVDIKDKSVESLLDQIFSGTTVSYEVVNKQIVLIDKGEVNTYSRNEQQQKTVSGKVTDSSGGSLPGVTVVVKGTTIGTITDANGKFSLSNIPNNAVLNFSFVGMKSQEVRVVGKTSINITLAEETVGLDEVIAVGYGTVKKQDLTGSVSKIKSESLQQHATTTLSESFAGQLAGVLAQQTKGGVPGAELSINIRGIHSINASNDPLYVVDGIPVTNMKDLNPNDVASIEVLKDASSAAIYGARGAGGVVLISTKTGHKGKATLDFDMSYGLQRYDKIMDLMNRDEYIAWNIWGRNEQWLRTGGSLSTPLANRSVNYPAKWLNPETLPDIDWQKQILRVAPMQNYQMTVSGGGDVGTYLISGSYMRQDGIMKETNYERATFRMNTVLDIGQKVKVGMNLAPSLSTSRYADSDLQQSTNVNLYAAVMAPIVPLNSNTQKWGYEPGMIGYPNPLELLKEVHQETKYNKVLGNVWGEWSIFKGLTFKSQIGLNFLDKHVAYYKPANVNLGTASNGTSLSDHYYNWSLQNTVTYKKQLASLLDFDVLLGQSIEGAKDYYLYGAKTGFPLEGVYTLNCGSTPTSAYSTETENSMASFFGRLNINAKDRYLFTANLRRDGSSRFGADKKWGWFPSASIGWKVNNEAFMKQFSNWLDLFKFRLSYGEAGNNSIGDYESVASLTYANYTFNGAQAVGLAGSNYVNTDIGWETKISKSVGWDISILKNRLQANFDIYVDDTKDMLLNAPLPYISGYTSVRQNLGEIRNKGWEFEFTSRNLQGVFNWTTSFNISRNKNKVISLGIDHTPIITSYGGSTTNITKEGEPIGSYYMYKTNGLLLEKDFDSAGKALVPIADGQEMGNVKAVDVNKDGKITTADLTIVGNNQPDFVWGITNRFSYKNFDLNVLVQGSHGGEIFFAGARHIDLGQTVNGFNQMRRWLHSWKRPIKAGEENPYSGMDVDLSWDGKTPNRFGNNLIHNDTWLYDASYIRIKNISVGYTFPKEICNRIGIGNARIYFSADNFYTWNHYPGNTSESNSFGNATTQLGSDYGTYPMARTYVLGINVTF